MISYPGPCGVQSYAYALYSPKLDYLRILLVKCLVIWAKQVALLPVAKLKAGLSAQELTLVLISYQRPILVKMAIIVAGLGVPIPV